ncbi:MAG: glutathione S-transferase [Pseudomonadales bacterium]|jgi:glutathione S-transferase|nr:glutathione S-transferase [Pseudomonadales bacterium]TNC90138.1 MAG: glutathione S-transferase [Alcanivorax sp.]HAG94320.1 glutathione S-transferase [Gammaproteobacteria bacterium]MAQ23666.1 glutathione S-transferase [Pseudomonadales bacterium]HAU13053.1 glutathione S-transferase [Gammaproteobacteria bacterium]|tara:strand:+ start:15665 stop:16294 length:630 start_codon:yes stop_codon:yes gene_type:complete
MNMRFYMTPGSCSTGIHILLEELELVFEAHWVDLLKGDNQHPDYLALNPKGTIPTLVSRDGSVFTDYVSIAWWLGRNHPDAGLIPGDLKGELHVLELMNYAVHVIHGQGFTRVFTPEQYLSAGGERERVISRGKDLVGSGFSWLSAKMVAGDVPTEFSLADPALFYIEFWADRIGLALPPVCREHYNQMLLRPAVRRVLMEEGYGSLFR